MKVLPGIWSTFAPFDELAQTLRQSLLGVFVASTISATRWTASFGRARHDAHFGVVGVYLNYMQCTSDSL